MGAADDFLHYRLGGCLVYGWLCIWEDVRVIGMRIVMTIKRGRLFISDRSYLRFLVELRHQANNEWREGLK